MALPQIMNGLETGTIHLLSLVDGGDRQHLCGAMFWACPVCAGA